MMKNYLTILAALLFTAAHAQDNSTIKIKPESGYNFKVVKDLEATPVQDQYKTGTCWSFSALGFFESELIRTGKGEHNLSEMYVVNHTYKEKAERYVRMHGKTNFGAGGAFVDIAHIWKKYGIVPESEYSGLNYGAEKHNHSELDNILEAYANAVIENKQKGLTTQWKKGYDAVVDTYLGEVPAEFEYRGNKYTPQSFAAELELNMDDYISITSYTHHDFYDKFMLEIPDNWLHVESYNVPLEEMMTIIDNAILNGYTFAWGADVSEKGFAFREGLAIAPEDESTIEVKGKDDKNFNNAGADKVSNAFQEPVKQLEVSQELRQQQFDNWETTDDHGMQVTGIVEDQNGDKYYMVKNSWGTTYNNIDGYFFASEAYVKLKTMNIYLHKDAVPKEILKKMQI
ncbi:MAG: C1 family peptidase [Flavobacteriales bacterium]|nr:C1 family peptidase [Flavobacteriales bacterium]